MRFLERIRVKQPGAERSATVWPPLPQKRRGRRE